MRLLFITPSFFSYQNDIADAFRAHGMVVDLVDERPSNTPLLRAIIRVAPQLAAKTTNQHFQKVSNRVRANPPDAVLVVKGENTPRWFMDELRTSLPDAVLVFYTFDSRDVSARGFSLREYFDRAFSFDRGDVAADPGLEYKSLFFTKEFAPGGRARDLDASFVGTLHSDRYRFVKSITRRIPSDRLRLFFYTPAAWYFWMTKALSSSNRRVPRKDVSTISMGRAEIASIFARSQTVIDIQRSNQSGLTMRTFEVLASGAALITTNEHVKAEDFYDPARILVVDGSDPVKAEDDVKSFLEAGPVTGVLPPGFADTHSVSAWTRHFIDVFKEEGLRP